MLTATGSLVTRSFYWQTARASDHGKLDESTEREFEARIADADRGDSSSNQPSRWGDSQVRRAGFDIGVALPLDVHVVGEPLALVGIDYDGNGGAPTVPALLVVLGLVISARARRSSLRTRGGRRTAPRGPSRSGVCGAAASGCHR